jgi:hypothetical protein
MSPYYVTVEGSVDGSWKTNGYSVQASSSRVAANRGIKLFYRSHGLPEDSNRIQNMNISVQFGPRV